MCLGFSVEWGYPKKSFARHLLSSGGAACCCGSWKVMCEGTWTTWRGRKLSDLGDVQNPHGCNILKANPSSARGNAQFRLRPCNMMHSVHLSPEATSVKLIGRWQMPHFEGVLWARSSGHKTEGRLGGELQCTDLPAPWQDMAKNCALCVCVFVCVFLGFTCVSILHESDMKGASNDMLAIEEQRSKGEPWHNIT